jgi:hypothetical protein
MLHGACRFMVMHAAAATCCCVMQAMACSHGLMHAYRKLHPQQQHPQQHP